MNFSDDRIIVSPDQTLSIKESRGSSPIPTDLIMEIFSRLPSKSVARYRFLSKFWSRVISSQYFIDLFTAKSSARPQILFLERNESGISFFSAPQPSENSSDNVPTTHLTHYPLSGCYNPRINDPINGLVCLSEFREYLGIRMYKSGIYNPSTGGFLTLPARRIHANMSNFLGYDPIEKQFKVLSLHFGALQNLNWGDMDNVFVDSQILTLETKELSWRMIECCNPHIPNKGNEICINGIFYYRALGVFHVQLIVCFDVKSETFKFMKVLETFNKELPYTATLTNYDGKLGLLISEEYNYLVTGKSKGFELWVLKDAEKHEWSNDVYILPPLWKTVVGETKLRFVGMIGTNEIVLSSAYLHECPCFFYYNIEKKTIRQLNIQGMEGVTTSQGVQMFLNYVEEVSLFKLLN